MTSVPHQTPTNLTVHGPMVKVTRRRWQLYFLPATVVAAALGAIMTAVTGELRTLFAPVPVICLWLLVRFYTPQEGILARRFSSDPDMLGLFCWGGLILTLITVVEIADCQVTGRKFGSPYEAYHIALMGPIVAIFLVGTFIFARRIDRGRNKEKADEQKAQSTTPVLGDKKGDMPNNRPA
jgi:hypothetical protein